MLVDGAEARPVLQRRGCVVGDLAVLVEGDEAGLVSRWVSMRSSAESTRSIFSS